MIKIAPSMLSANFATLSEEIKSIELAGADLLHIDIMDGHFIPNLTFGAPIVKAIRPYTQLPFDVHLMVTNPGDYVEEFAKIGVEYFTFHQETVPHMHRLIQHIKQCGMKAGVALNPSTPVSLLEDVAADLDMILIMSVNPVRGSLADLHCILFIVLGEVTDECFLLFLQSQECVSDFFRQCVTVHVHHPCVVHGDGRTYLVQCLVK